MVVRNLVTIQSVKIWVFRPDKKILILLVSVYCSLSHLFCRCLHLCCQQGHFDDFPLFVKLRNKLGNTNTKQEGN